MECIRISHSKNYGIQPVMLRHLEEWRENVITKAFDGLLHTILPAKLAVYGVDETCGIWCWWNLRHMVLMKLVAYDVDETCGIWCWWNFLYYYYIDFYHQNRKQSVQVNNINSDLLSQASNKELKLGQFYLIISLITFFILLKLQMPTILPTITH